MRKSGKDSYDQLIDQIWAIYDRNQTGKLERHELRSFIVDLFRSQSIQLPESAHREILALIDSNKNGVIEKPEFKTLLINVNSANPSNKLFLLPK